MPDINIQMKNKIGETWNKLFPKTKISLVEGLPEKLDDVDSKLTAAATKAETEAKIAIVNEQLADITHNPIVQNGRIVTPSDFPSTPFNIYKRGDSYYHDATPYNQHNWSGAIEVFITSRPTGGDYTGTDPKRPIGFNKFITNLAAGTYYGSATKFILSILDNVLASADILLLTNQGVDVLIRSRSINGFTWWSRFKRPGASSETSVWTADSSVYKTTQAAAHEVVDIVNPLALYEFGGMPKPYVKVATLAECQATKGAFYQNGTSVDVWCNPHIGHDPAANLVLVSTKICRINITTPNTIMFENIGFAAGSMEFMPDNIGSQLYWFGCKFHRNYNDSFAITGKYNCYVLDCITSYASKDCFNYHADTMDCFGVEVNGNGYGAGMYKFSNGNQTTNSNNGSTAHDGMFMLRVGGKYWDCEGPIVADVNNCYSISVGCQIGGLLPTTTGEKAGFYFDEITPTNRPDSAPKYVVDCVVSGKYIEYDIKGTPLTYEVGTKGRRVFDGGVQSIALEDME